MAVLYVTEYVTQISDPNGKIVPAAEEPALLTDTVAIGASSTQGDVFNVKTKFVRVHTDVACHVAFGDNPTASTSSMRLAANQTEYFGVQAGQRLAVIEA